jgi:hypothetical protein
MKLSSARLCLQCDELFERYPDFDMNGKIIGYRSDCPACGNTHTVPLTKWLPAYDQVATGN